MTDLGAIVSNSAGKLIIIITVQELQSVSFSETLIRLFLFASFVGQQGTRLLGYIIHCEI